MPLSEGRANVSVGLGTVLTIFGGILLGYSGWAGVQIISIGDRLSRMEATMEANKEERVQQIDDIRARVRRLEEREDRGAGR